MNLTKEFWEKAYKENASLMLGVCRRYVQNKELAEDLMQDAFLSAMSKSESFKGSGSINGWLRKIAVNTALMHLRTEKSKKISADLISNESEYQIMDDPNVGDIKSLILQADFSDSELLSAIDMLPEHHKLVFNLYVIDNYTHVQIGQELNISPGTSKSHLARARKKIQQSLYEKAREKTKDQKKKSTLFLLLFSWKPDYLDGLIRKKLTNLSVSSLRDFNIPENESGWNKYSIPKFKSAIFSSKLSYLLTGLTAGIIILSVLIHLSIDSGKSALPEPDFSGIPKADSVNQASKTEKPETGIIPDSVLKSSEPQPVSKEKVVVRKTIIKHKTITIRDTIRIKDSSNAK
jgi:RNA polymerase sigma factor (sigma-70 family)